MLQFFPMCGTEKPVKFLLVTSYKLSFICKGNVKGYTNTVSSFCFSSAKIQKILEAVTSEHFPLYLLMKDADYDNYTAFLQQMNEEDRKIRLEQEKLLLFMKLEEL